MAAHATGHAVMDSPPPSKNSTIMKMGGVMLLVVWMSIGGALVALHATGHLGDGFSLIENRVASASDLYSLEKEYKRGSRACATSDYVSDAYLNSFARLDGSSNNERGKGAANSVYHHYRTSLEYFDAMNTSFLRTLDEDVMHARPHPTHDPGGLNALVPAWLVFVGAMLSKPHAPPDDHDHYLNGMTSFLDAACVYGVSDKAASHLRTYKHGMIKTDTVEDGEFVMTDPQTGQYMMANDDVAMHAVVLALHVIVVREHNWWCRRLMEHAPHAPDEELFQRARRNVVMELQVITYQELLPEVMGREVMNLPCYNPGSNPAVSVEWALAGVPALYSMLPRTMGSYDTESGRRSARTFHIEHLLDQTPDANAFQHATCSELLLSAMYTPAENLDTRVNGPGLPTYDPAELWGSCGHPAGLKHRLACHMHTLRSHANKADFAGMRWMFYGAAVTDWSSITPDQDTADHLAKLYGAKGYSNVDLLLGLMAESDDGSKSLGTTLALLFADQLSRCRNSDAYSVYWNVPYYANGETILATRMSDLLARTTDINHRLLKRKEGPWRHGSS